MSPKQFILWVMVQGQHGAIPSRKRLVMVSAGMGLKIMDVRALTQTNAIKIAVVKASATINIIKLVNMFSNL